MSHWFFVLIGVIPWTAIVVALWRLYGGPSRAEQEANLAARMRLECNRLESLADLPEPMGRPVARRKVHAAIGPQSEYTREVVR